MSNVAQTPFEADMAAEGVGLLRFAESSLPGALSQLSIERYDRIILTGMGGSDCATIPLELALAAAGLPVWRIVTGRLLEMLPLVSDNTLLLITSQSGRSGEVVALLERLPRRPRTIIAITADGGSPLAEAADHVVLLESGPEATVATKSYANTLAASHRLAGLLQGQSDSAAVDDIRAAAISLQLLIDRGNPAIHALVPRLLSGPKPRLAIIGFGPDAATTLAGAMVLKEAAKVTAEGYIGGAFRHGPLELAGPGLTALILGKGGADDVSPNTLAMDIAATGSSVVTIAPEPYSSSDHIEIAGRTVLERLLHGMYVMQSLSVGLARASGLVPGAFLYGSKVTAQV